MLTILKRWYFACLIRYAQCLRREVATGISDGGDWLSPEAIVRKRKRLVALERKIPVPDFTYKASTHSFASNEAKNSATLKN